MSYDTYYNGEVSITPTLTAAHLAMLHAIADMSDNPNTYEALVPEDMRTRLEALTEEESKGTWEFEFNADPEPDFLKFEFSTGWTHEEECMKIMLEVFFKPLGYSLEGDVHWQGGEDEDRGYIYFNGQQMEAVHDEITNPGPSWDKQPSLQTIIAEVKELLKNATYADGQATVLTKDCEALEAAIKTPEPQSTTVETTGDLQDFCVTWEIEVQAVTPEGAAREAKTIQRDPKSLAQTFKVYPCSNSLKVEEITLT